MEKHAPHYTDEELKTMKEQWLKDKKRIDEECEGFYPRDLDQEYKRYLSNKSLQKLFGYAAYLMHGLREGDMFIYPNEEGIINKVYWEVLKNGYFTASKTYEKKISNWLAKAISRQTYRRYRK